MSQIIFANYQLLFFADCNLPSLKFKVWGPKNKPPSRAQNVDEKSVNERLLKIHKVNLTSTDFGDAVYPSKICQIDLGNVSNRSYDKKRNLQVVFGLKKFLVGPAQKKS